MSESQGSAGVPYLGSKISLISKAEIRYEGTLYTIDPQEATVALAKVRSFGTEDRPTDRPVAPRNEVFEFIIFRGQDIKDLNVCEPPQPQPTEGVPLDPAIVRSSQPPPNPGGATYATASSGHPPGQLYHPSVEPVHFEQQSEFSVPPPLDQHQQPSPSQHQQTSQGQQQLPSQGQQQLPSQGQQQLPSQGQQQLPSQVQQQLPSQVQQQLPSPDQHQLPSPSHHQLPSQGYHQQPPQGPHHQTSLKKPPAQGQHQEPSHGHQQQPPQGPHHQTSLKKPPTQGHPPETSQGHQQQLSHGQHRQPDSAGKEPPSRLGHSIEQAILTQPPPAYSARPAANSQISTLPYGGKAASNNNAQGRSDSPENAPNSRQRNSQQYPPPSYHGQGMRRGGGHHQNSNADNRGRDERAQPPSYSRERNSGRVLIRGGPHRGGQWGGASGGHQSGRSAEPLKFDTEFDFESSNAQFTKESIDKELKNLSLGDKPAVAGDKEEEEFEEEADDSEVIGDDPVYYNKAKSFFDNISCEATEPSKGQRFSWNEGRKLNSETFGIRENYRRNYRGRGNWRGGADHSGFGGGQGGGRWRGDGGYGNNGWNSRGRGGFQREAGGRYGGNAGANGQGRRNWGYDDRAQKDSHPRVDVRS